MLLIHVLFFGKNTLRRSAVGIWKCRACKKVLAGGAYTVSTPAATTVRSTVRRLREAENYNFNIILIEEIKYFKQKLKRKKLIYYITRTNYILNKNQIIIQLIITKRYYTQ